MSIDRALEIMEYFTEYPPQNVTLALVHLEQKNKRRAVHIQESDAMAQMSEVSTLMGSMPEQVPAHLREMAAWAAEMGSHRVN